MLASWPSVRGFGTKRGAHALVALVALAACGPPPEAPPAGPIAGLSGEALGTTYSVKIVARLGAADLEAVRSLVAETLAEVDRAMSTYRDDSELMAFNRLPAGEPFAFSPATFSVLESALAVAHATDGAFDIAVGPLVNAWGFGPDGVGSMPDEATIAALMERIDARRQLTLDSRAQTALKARDDVFVDLSGIAKGYAVDRLAAALRGAGFQGFLVEVGGEMRGSGVRHDGAPWRVGVEQPVALRGVVQRILSLADASIATSGDYRNVREHEGKRISHIIDPRTGRSIDHAATSVSVIADDCTSADAWATALLVLGPEAGLASAESHGIAALFLVRQAGGDHTEVMTTAFRQRFSGPAPAPRQDRDEPP